MCESNITLTYVMYVVQVQHYYANSSSFPANLYQRTVLQYNMDYHHEIYVSPRPLDMSLQQDRVLVGHILVHNGTHMLK